MLTTLLKLLRREQKITSHEDLPELVESLGAFIIVESFQTQPVTLHVVKSRLRDLRAIVARTKGLLHPEDNQANGVSTTVGGYFHTRETGLPGGRHDNDKMDIAEGFFPRNSFWTLGSISNINYERNY